MEKKIGIVDYKVGNIGSLSNAINYLKFKAELVSDPKKLKNYDKIILPGVGNFNEAMEKLKFYGFHNYLNEFISDKTKSLLGICLGMQLLGIESEEGNAQGLSFLNFKSKKLDNKKKEFKVPNIGWCSINKKKNNFLLNEIYGDDFYFVHSYAVFTDDDELIIATTNYSEEFVSIIGKNNIFGVQFHPEKSDLAGLKLIKNFLQN